MGTLFVEESESLQNRRLGFFARQFAPEVTRPQLTFDLIFGVVGPVLCFYFDPTVFRGGVLEAPLLMRLQVVAYAISIIQIPILATWLLFGRQLRSFSAPIGGVLIAGGFFSFVIGLLILPYSLVGLIVLIGILGFTPFLTAYVYFRNGRRALVARELNSAYAARFLIATLCRSVFNRASSIGQPRHS